MYLTFQSKIKSGASSSYSTSSEVSSSEVSYNFSRKAGITLSSSDESRRPGSFSGNAGVTTAMSTYDESRLRIAKPRRNIVTVSLSCSELCAIIFVVGVVVGNPLKTGVWKWVSKLLRRSKDD